MADIQWVDALPKQRNGKPFEDITYKNIMG